jgi:hypothetical protein
MLEKIKSLQINFALIAFLAFMVKVLTTDASIADSIILLGLGTVYSYTQYLKRFQPYKLDDAIIADLKEVKIAISKMNLIKASEKLTEKRYF